VSVTGRPSEAELEAAGLYDPAAPLAATQLALIEYLLDLGATFDELVAAGPANLIELATSSRLWGDRERFTFDEAAAMSGTDSALLRKFWRAAGFPDPDPGTSVLTRRDIEIFGILVVAIEFLGEEVALQLIRVIGAAAARVGEASVSLFNASIGPSAIEADPTGLELVRANETSIALLDGLTNSFDVMLRHNIERFFRPLQALGSTPGVDLVERSIGFADLVESTAWTQGLELRELAHALEVFEATSSEIVVACGGRVVKLIGDEAMFAANDPVAATQAALGLVDAFAAHTVLPPVRVGVASGSVVARDGDYSGTVVNLAARAVKLAPPSSVLVDEATRAPLDDEFVCTDAGRSELKGFAASVPLFRVTRNG
jgi:class 3 adenylate cyclase